MLPPRLDLIPLRPAVRSDAAHVLDVLVRIGAPESDSGAPRPAINLGLVLDNSSSMKGTKIEQARAAAIYTVDQLLPGDRVSVTTFNSAVLTIVPTMLVAAKRQAIVDRIGRVQPGAGTALFPGWKEGARQVGRHRISDGVNRVVLLSDGQANRGQTDPMAIADEVRALAGQGVSTTTIGVGDDFHEDLMEAMARAGGGNYHYIESPDQLPAIFRAELQDMVTTFGHRVRLAIEPRHGATVAIVLNDFPTTGDGEQMLPDLVPGKSVGVLVRLNVPPRGRAEELCRFHLGWEAPGASTRRTLGATLTLPAVAEKEWKALTPDAGVREHLALLLAARAKKEAVRALDRGDTARAKLLLAKSRLAASSIVPSPLVKRELDDLDEIEADLDRGAVAKVNKKAKFQSWSRLSASNIVPSPLDGLEGEGAAASRLRSRLSASSIGPSPLDEADDHDRAAASALSRSRLSTSTIMPSPSFEAEEE